ncbi:disulfide bond formation protein B [Tritonibacter scottomollicae]|uniref:Disulfide bond formation protein DsbB n=1 Tax=Tritonibacter scottomollicae TaxID=483013 RepID=A0A2T1AH62_TRISK|nr:disulfide bond formation protein B [Tritonibacter scottomollicae]PRZ47924.1 disulfide bond formation protein DsbB [Tritonibacter scottomollicae]
MTFSRFLILLAAGGSAALLLGAFGFQYIGELAPCKMCIWQRYPHGAAVGIGVLAMLIPGAVLPYLGALAALATSAIGAFHAGVEQGWWEGPTTCTSGAIDGLSADDLMSQIMSAPLVRCDDIPWEMLGLSMAGWNAVISLGLAALWFAAARHTR